MDRRARWTQLWIPKHRLLPDAYVKISSTGIALAFIASVTPLQWRLFRLLFFNFIPSCTSASYYFRHPQVIHVCSTFHIVLRIIFVAYN